jgi:REP element-mobilizing transposase RayT
MPSPPKIFYPGSVHVICASVEEGIMFPPNALVNEILKKCLAQAQELHPIELCHYLFSGTHFHMLARVIDPQDMADFMERFKTESAHAINRLLGRKKRTVWCEGYDSPVLEDVETVQEKIAYLYENPSRDGLAESVERYPGLSSWGQFKAGVVGERRYETRYIPRDDIEALPKRTLSEREYESLRRKLIHKKKKNHFRVDCNAWMKRFGIEDTEAQREVNREIEGEVGRREEGHRAQRQGQAAMGRKALVETKVGREYVPERSGKKMLIHSVHREFRKERIRFFRELIAEGREVLERWRQGDMACRYPRGLFPPSGIRLVEPIGW